MFQGEAFSSDDDGGVEAAPSPRSNSVSQPSTCSAPVINRFHEPGDREFTPFALPIGEAPSDAFNAAGDEWVGARCRCLRCEVVRVGEAVTVFRTNIAELTHGLNQPRRPQPSAPRPASTTAEREGSCVRKETVTTTTTTVVIDLDNFGFPQFKQPAPAALGSLLMGHGVYVWAFYGGYFTRFFKVNAEEYLNRIAVGPIARIAGLLPADKARRQAAQGRDTEHRQVAADATGRSSTNGNDSRRRQRSREEGEEGDRSGSANHGSCMSTWAALKCAGAVSLTPCGGKSQAADTLILHAVGLAATFSRVVVATGDRPLQEQLRQSYLGSDVHVLPTKGITSSIEFWAAVRDLVAVAQSPAAR